MAFLGLDTNSLCNHRQYELSHKYVTPGKCVIYIVLFSMLVIVRNVKVLQNDLENIIWTNYHG